jgi:hypothetical protein
MKTILKCLLSLVAVFGMGVSLSQAGQFEGEVDYHVTMSNGDQSDMAYFLKDGKARMQMSMKGHDVVDIMDLPNQKIYMLMSEQKMYMTSDIPKSEKAQGNAKVDVKKTGKTKTILGYNTDEWAVTTEHGTTSVWGAKGIGFFMMGKGPGGQGPDTSWADALKKNGFFPLEVDSQGGKGSMSMVATKVEPKSLDSSLFTVPADYKDMSAMMQGMGAGMPSGMPKF